MRACAIAAAIVAMQLPGFSGARAAGSDAAKAKAEPCAACHGEAGLSALDNIPSLAGQPDAFVQWQLVYFRSGARKNEIMQPIAEALDNADVRALGAYFAALAPPKPPAPDDKPDLTKAGARLAVQHRCAQCHLESYAGTLSAARLSAQREDYLLKSLRDFKAGARTGGGVASMPEVAYALSDDDMRALAQSLALHP
jgi:cytochrome c553